MTLHWSRLVVRRAKSEDAYMLWLWANDAATRRASFHRHHIPWSDHISWFGQQLGNKSAIVLICQTADALPVGSIRFDTDDSWNEARLSYVVAPEARGQGLSRSLIELGIGQLAERHGEVVVHALVDDSNERSLAVFRRLHWDERADPQGTIFCHTTTRDDV